MGKIDEVCLASNGRLLVFGSAGPATSMVIINPKGGKVENSIWAYNPVASPNQHWLIYRYFYPPQSEVPISEEYLLYDLTKSKAANRSPRFTGYAADAQGRVVYPAVTGRYPFEHSALRPDQSHRFRSNAFYWSDDSQMVVFADSVQNVLSIVLVTIDEDQPHAFVHKLTPAEACEQGSKGDVNAAYLVLSHAEVTSSEIELQFRSSDYGTCKPVPLMLAQSDFVPAQLEVHNPPHRKDNSTMEPEPRAR